MTAHSVNVLLRPNGDYHVQTYSMPIRQPWRADGVPTVVPAGADATTLGNAILVALDRSTVGVITMPPMSEVPPDREVLAWAGVKTWSAYTRGSRSVGIRAEYDNTPVTARVRPDVRDRTGAYSGMSDEYSIVTAATPNELGVAALRGLEIATS